MPVSVPKVKMPQSPPYASGTLPAPTDLVWIWDVATGVLRQAPISSLPFTNSGGSGSEGSSQVAQPSPFMVTNSMGIYSYDAATNSITIKDVRLLNRSFYPVSTTQFGGGDIRLSELTYKSVSDDDPTKGALVIRGFQLENNEHITINIPGTSGSTDPVYQQLIADVATLKKLTAPFALTALGANGGRVWWSVTDAIPDGWQEDTTMRGLLPMAQDPAQTEFSTIGHTGGAKSQRLAANNIPQLSTTIERPKKMPDVDRGNTGGSSSWSLDDVEVVTVTFGTPGAQLQNVQTLNPHKVGRWIKYVG